MALSDLSTDGIKDGVFEASDYKPDERTIHLHGYDVKIDANAVDDVDMIPLMTDINRKGGTEPMLMIDFAKQLLGEKEYDKMAEHFKNDPKTRRFPLTYLVELYTKAVECLNPKE